MLLSHHKSIVACKTQNFPVENMSEYCETEWAELCEFFLFSSISTTAKTIQLAHSLAGFLLFHFVSRATAFIFKNENRKIGRKTHTHACEHAHALIQSRRTLVTSDKTIGDGEKVFYPENFARNFLSGFLLLLYVWSECVHLIDNASNERTPFNIERVHQQNHWIEETTMMTMTMMTATSTPTTKWLQC